MDECNFHLSHVAITWPPNFALPPSSESSKVTGGDGYTVLPPPTSAHFPTLPHLQCSTRLALAHLAAGLEGSGSVWPAPDMARRQVSVEFSASASSHGRKPLDVTATASTISPMLCEQKMNSKKGVGMFTISLFLL